MPISITLPPPGTFVGPGYVIQLSSDFIGPLPLGTQFEVRISTHPEGQPNVIWQFIPTQQPTIAIFVADRFTTSSQNGAETVPAGSSVHVIAELKTDAQVVLDSGRVDATYDPSTMLWQHINENTAAQGGGGLTTTEKQQLQDTERRTRTIGEPTDLVIDTASGPQLVTLAQMLARSALDRLTMVELTDGETCEPFRASWTLPTWYTALVVRVTRIAPDLVPRTPDEQWYFPDLAVLRVFRGVDLEYRRGIHTPTFIVRQPWQWGWPILNQTQILGTPPETNINVDWREGCCGQVFALTILTP